MTTMHLHKNNKANDVADKSAMGARLRNVITNAKNQPRLYISSKTFRLLHPQTVRHTTQFTSIGGVGTTFLYEFAKDVGLDIYHQFDGGSITSDYGVWKHMRAPIDAQRNPEVKLRSGYRVVYLYGNPKNAVISIFRRGYQTWIADRLQLPESARRRFDPTWSLIEYLEQGTDLLLLEDHIRNWTTREINKKYPILALRYEAIDAHRDRLLDFLEVPRRMRDRFPGIQPRRSNYRDLPTTVQQKLDYIYGRSESLVDSLPDIFER